MTPTHSIRQQTLEIQIDSEAAALALQAGISDINRQRLLPLIEQVLDEFTVPGRRIRIDRLTVDLGELPFENFADAAEHALPPALRRALAQALRDGSEDHRIQPETVSRLELLEHYLVEGALPFWESGETFSVDAMLQQLAGDDPAGLVALVTRHAQDRRLLERIVLQLDDVALQRLLHLVTPAHAALILAYMLDLNRIHRAEPLLSLRGTDFENLLWVLVLSYLLRDAGSQFNRRSFLRWLLEGLAESGALDFLQLVETLRRGLQQNFLQLVETLRRGLQQMKRHQAPSSSLPAALDELLQELRDEGFFIEDDAPAAERAPGVAIPAADRPWQALEQLLMHGRPPSASPPASDIPLEQQLLRILHDHPDALREFIREHGGDARLIGRLVEQLPEAMLVRLLALLDPEHAALILAYLLDIRSVHRVTPLVALNDRRFDRLLWLLVLNYVIDNPGSQFNRKSLVLSLLQGMAQSEGLDLADLIETLRRGLAAIETHLSSATSLPAIIRELAGEAAGPIDTPALPAASDLLAAWDGDDILRHVLNTGLLPWDAWLPGHPAGTSRGREQLAQLSPARIRAIYAEVPVREPAAVTRHLASALPEAALLALLQRLLPAEAATSPLRSSLARFAAQATDRRVFYAGIIATLLGGDVIDFERWASFAGETTAAGTLLLPGAVLEADPRRMRSLLLAQLAIGDTAVQSGVVIQDLLQAVIDRHPGDARHFIAAIAGQPELRAALAKQVSETVLRAMMTASDPAEATTSGDHAEAPIEPATAAAALRLAAMNFLRGESEPDEAGRPHAPPSDELSDDMLAYALRRALDDDAEAIGALVRQLAVDRRQRQRWIRLLPGAALARLSHAIEPERHHALLGAAEILVAAWRRAAPRGAGGESAHAQLWGMLFDFLAAHRGLDRSVERLVADFLARAASLGGDFAARLRAAAVELAGAAGDRRLIAALDNDKPKTPAIAEAGARLSERPSDAQAPVPRRDKAPGRLPMKTAFGLIEDAARARGDPIYIGNAGLVLASAFLPHLFRELDLLGVDDDNRPRLRDRDAISRAVHLLQYLVDDRTDAPEPLLVFNKILCGVPTATPIARAIAISDEEQRLCDSLLHAMIANWTILKGTSVTGLRETFLQREGKLQRVDDGWKLRVQRKTLDVLVDQVPWSISILLAPWMRYPVHVTW